MNKQELNKKLAEWAGFEGRFISKYLVGGVIDYTIKGYEYPDGRHRERLPRFTQSLDACFKWLTPQLESIYGSPYSVTFNFSSIYVTCMLHNLSTNALTPALALCLAVEKLIDMEEKHD